MKVLITGSREWADKQAVKDALVKAKATVIVHGAARGADALAAAVAHELKLEIRPYPADWAKHGKAAGPIRNRQMLKEEHVPDDPVDLCLAFPLPKSIGTFDMIDLCKKAGIPVIGDIR